jgi:hypothetical protein
MSAAFQSPSATRSLWLPLVLGLFIFGLFGCGPAERHLPPGGAYHGDPALPVVEAKGPSALRGLPLGTVLPKGWLRDQLRVQADGLGGHIEEVWKDLGPSNAWRGGHGDAWERGPYYLDGLVPLAFLLQDPALLERMQAWMDWNLGPARQQGAFGPAGRGDWWPDMVFAKALAQYAEASGDPRAMDALVAWGHQLQAELPHRRLDAWRAQRRYDENRRGDEDLVGQSDRWQYYRWQEASLDLLWLQEQRPDPAWKAVAKELRAEGYDWSGDFRHFRFTAKTTRDQVWLANHGVNNAMALRALGLDRWLGGPGGSQQAFETLMRFHGQPQGLFACDEQLGGRDPSQGIELCSVVEAAYSFETLYRLEGGTWAAEAAERAIYNALPAAFDASMWVHQYDQQANQVLVSQEQRLFTNNGPRANLFGLEPEWGCCTANFHQGWPKFAASLWMAAPGGLQALSYAPCQVQLRLPQGQHFTLDVDGAYPFDGDVSLRVILSVPADLALRLPIPRWAEGASLVLPDGSREPLQPGSVKVLQRRWEGVTQLRLQLPMQARVRHWDAGLVVERGPLLLVHDVEADVQKAGSDAWSDQRLRPTAPWNWGLRAKAGAALPEDGPVVLRGPVFDRASTPVRLKAPAQRVANWGLVQASAGPLPTAPQTEGVPENIDLIPFGASRLRVTVFPALE